MDWKPVRTGSSFNDASFDAAIDFLHLAYTRNFISDTLSIMVNFLRVVFRIKFLERTVFALLNIFHSDNSLHRFEGKGSDFDAFCGV